MRDRGESKVVVRDVFLAFHYLQRVRMRTQVDRTSCTAYLAADGAYAELVRYWRAGLDGESHCSTVATSFEFNWHDKYGDRTLLKMQIYVFVLQSLTSQLHTCLVLVIILFAVHVLTCLHA